MTHDPSQLDLSSLASGASTSAFSGPGMTTGSSRRSIPTAAQSSQPGSPGSPSTKTSKTSTPPPDTSTSSPGASPAKTSASPASGPGSPGSGQDSSMSSCESLTLSIPAQSSLRTSKGSTALEALRAQTSGSSSTRWPNSGIWRRGELLTRSTSGCHSDADACSCAPSLSQILQPDASEKYSLSQKAATGILRRARNRGRSLPAELETALEAVAGLSTASQDEAPAGSTTSASEGDSL